VSPGPLQHLQIPRASILHRRAHALGYIAAFPPPRIPIRAPAGAAMDDGRRTRTIFLLVVAGEQEGRGWLGGSGTPNTSKEVKSCAGFPAAEAICSIFAKISR
jgi:hypothetical protein